MLHYISWPNNNNHHNNNDDDSYFQRMTGGTGYNMDIQQHKATQPIRNKLISSGRVPMV